MYIYIYIDTIKELWEEINKNCTMQNNDWCLYDLNIKTIQVSEGEDNVMVYVCRLKAIWHEIEHFWPVESP